MYNDYIPVIVFAALAIGLLIAPLIIQHLVSPRHNKRNDKLMSYECGEVLRDQLGLNSISDFI